MDDRTLIERAAKAAGYAVDFRQSGDGIAPVLLDEGGTTMTLWNPLVSDSQIARLEAACEIEIEWCRLGVIAKKQMPSVLNDVRVRVLYADHNGDKQKARRYASTRAAASLAMGE